MGRYLVGSDLSPEFLNTGHTDDVFHEDGKHFSFRQRLKSFARIGAISGAVFLRTITGISSGLVAFDTQSWQMNLATSFTVTWMFEIIEVVREGNSGTTDPRFPFVANMVAKSFALSLDDATISGPSSSVGIGDFPRFSICFWFFQNDLEPRASSSICSRIEDL